MEIVKSISVLLEGRKSRFRKPTCLGHGQISGCYGISSAHPKKLTTAGLKLDFFNFGATFVALPSAK